MRLVKLLRALATAAPSNDIRYYFNTVYFERVNHSEKENFIYVIVTTGFYIIRAKVIPELVPELKVSGENLLITRKSMLSALKDFRIGDNIRLEKSDGEWFVKDLGASKYKLLDVCDGRFPSWRRVWGNKGSNSTLIPEGIKLRPDLLIKVSRVLNSVNATNTVHMTFGDSSDPIHFKHIGSKDVPSVLELEARLCPCKF